jgi:CheY-like chemotaxis protein
MATIMLIDDDVDLVEMNRAVLTHKGHTVKWAYSAKDASKMLESAPVDLAVVDVMMESMSAGFDLVRELHERFPKLPMVVVTGVHQALDLQFKFTPDKDWLPALKVLEKPLAPADLAKEVEAILAAQ